MGTTADASRRAGDLLADLGLWDTVLAQLREDGFSQVQAMEATIDRLGVPLADAKRIVHLSAAWADSRAENDSFHEALEQTASSDRSGFD